MKSPRTFTKNEALIQSEDLNEKNSKGKAFPDDETSHYKM